MNNFTFLGLYQRLFHAPTPLFWAEVRNAMIKLAAAAAALIALNQTGQIAVNPQFIHYLTEGIKIAGAIGITAQATTVDAPPPAA